MQHLTIQFHKAPVHFVTPEGDSCFFRVLFSPAKTSWLPCIFFPSRSRFTAESLYESKATIFCRTARGECY